MTELNMLLYDDDGIHKDYGNEKNYRTLEKHHI